MSDETFYGVALTGEKNTVTWDVLSNDEEYAYPQAQKLIIKQILLGAEAKEDEFNVVEAQINPRVQTVKDSIKIPLAVLKAGETRALNPDVEFYDTAVTFTLIKGTGPVYIHGQNIKDEVVDVDIDEDETEDDDEAEEDTEDKPPKKKLKQDNNVVNEKNQKNKKK